MAIVNHQPSKLVLAWFVISSLIVCWDTGYILLRPHSFKGGKYHFLWQPYDLYGKVDLIYSRRFYEAFNGFTAAQGYMNIIETILNFAYVYMAAIDGRPAWRAASPVLGLSVALMTFWKTVLYWLQDYLSGPKGWGYTGHNSAYDFFVLFALPNGFWLLVPLILTAYFAIEIAGNLQAAAGVSGFDGPAGSTRSRQRKSLKGQ